MRRISEFESEAEASRFVDHLLTLGIDARVRTGDDSTSQVWIVEDSEIPRAQNELEIFRSDPSAARYAESARTAKSLRTEERKRREKSRHEEIRFRTRFDRPPAFRTPVSMGFIAICSLLFVMTDLGQTVRFENGSVIVAPAYEALGFADRVFFEGALYAPWRRLTTQLFHGGLIHFAFCMLVIHRHLPLVEGRLGSVGTLILCVLLAIGAALGQWLPHGIAEWTGERSLEVRYVGMSGVLYGIIGLVWTLGRRAPRFGLDLSASSAYVYGVFFVLGFLVPWIADGAHTGGLVTGVLAGLVIAAVVKRGTR